MNVKNDLIMECKWTMSFILTNLLEAQDRKMNIEAIEKELVIDTNNYYTLKDNLKYMDIEEVEMIEYNLECDLNYIQMLLRKLA